MAACVHRIKFRLFNHHSRIAREENRTRRLQHPLSVSLSHSFWEMVLQDTSMRGALVIPVFGGVIKIFPLQLGFVFVVYLPLSTSSNFNIALLPFIQCDYHFHETFSHRPLPSDRYQRLFYKSYNLQNLLLLFENPLQHFLDIHSQN